VLSTRRIARESDVPDGPALCFSHFPRRLSAGENGGTSTPSAQPPRWFSTATSGFLLGSIVSAESGESTAGHVQANILDPTGLKEQRPLHANGALITSASRGRLERHHCAADDREILNPLTRAL